MALASHNYSENKPLYFLHKTSEGHLYHYQSLDTWKSDVKDSSAAIIRVIGRKDIISVNGIKIKDICRNISHRRCKDLSCKLYTKLCQHVKQMKNTTMSQLETFTLVYAVIAVAVSMIGLLVNTLAFIVAYKLRASLPTCRLYIAELAIVNFLFCVVQLINVIPLFWTRKCIYTFIMCTMIRTLLEMTCLLNSGFISMIAVERYLIIVHQKDGSLDRRLKHVLIMIVTLCVMITMIPFLFGLHIDEYDGRWCLPKDNSWM